MLLSPMSEYEPSFPGPHNYPMSSAPSSAPLYEIVSGVSSASYNSPSMTVTSSGVAYAPMTATMHAPAPRMMHSGLSSNGQQSWSNGQNNNGGGSLHHQQAPSGHSNLSDLLYDEDMLGTF